MGSGLCCSGPVEFGDEQVHELGGRDEGPGPRVLSRAERGDEHEVLRAARHGVRDEHVAELRTTRSDDDDRLRRKRVGDVVEPRQLEQRQVATQLGQMIERFVVTDQVQATAHDTLRIGEAHDEEREPHATNEGEAPVPGQRARGAVDEQDEPRQRKDAERSRGLA
jgi:hypothetical protein